MERFADRFVLRQFRITETVAGLLFKNNSDILSRLGISGVQCNKRTAAETFQLLAGSWLSNSRSTSVTVPRIIASTEAMMRGTVTENAAINALRAKTYIEGVFQCGMFSDKEHRWLSCSQDGLALIDINKTAFNISDSTEPQPHVCSVGITTSIADNTL